MATTSIGTKSGTINIANEHDWFRVSLTANTLYEITTSGLDFSWLTVYDASGTEVAGADAYGDPLGFMPATGGTYYIDVSDGAGGSATMGGLGDGVGPYTLYVDAVSDDYRNNTATTGTVAVGGSATGTINIANEHDWFRVSLTANTLYEITTSGLDFSWLTVYDASGTEVAGADAYGDPLGFMPATGGTYYIDVSDGAGGSATMGGLGDGVGPYTLYVDAVSDDYRNNTATTGTVAVGGSATGTINIANEHDWFRVSLTANTLYEITTSGLDFSWLTVYDASGTEVAGADAYGDPLGFMPATGGTYYIDVSDGAGGSATMGGLGDGVGPYTLYVDAVSDDYRNNTATTGTVAVGGSATGTINIANEHDWFRVSLTANTLYEITTSGLDFSWLTVYDASGTEVAGADAYGDPLGFMPATGGTYYIDVSDGAGGSATMGGLGDGVGPYTLYVDAVSDDYRNNTATTGTVAVGGSATGTINIANEHDWFRVSLTANTLYEITTSGLDFSWLTVYDASGTEVAGADAYGDPLGFMPATGGTYYIDVSDGAGGSATMGGLGDGVGPYTLYVDAVSDDYRNNTATTGTVGSQGTSNPISGTSGNDNLNSTSANDTLDGGAGIDTAVYDGTVGQYGITLNRAARTATVTDSQAGREGTDTLSNVEKLQFGGQSFDLFNPALTSAPKFGQSRDFLFDAAYYLLSHPELAGSLSLQTAFDHYLNTGAALGYEPNNWFDPGYYENRWADLKTANLDDATLFLHYNLYGVWEGRSAGPTFDRYDGNRYLTDYPDVAAYVDAYVNDFLGSRTNGAIAHYIIYGANEGRLAYDLAGIPIDTSLII